MSNAQPAYYSLRFAGVFLWIPRLITHGAVVFTPIFIPGTRRKAFPKANPMNWRIVLYNIFSPGSLGLSKPCTDYEDPTPGRRKDSLADPTLLLFETHATLSPLRKRGRTFSQLLHSFALGATIALITIDINDATNRSMELGAIGILPRPVPYEWDKSCIRPDTYNEPSTMVRRTRGWEKFLDFITFKDDC
ncbi:hypothetical protein B0J12DRAFT_699855 [Macrophomina phaseolina]|uniref:Uncharacterized protein n=1 Tax=Macrophomina phaseolina TaxID=35725 RepID=A0ABQ8G9I2_9PEZI|nr:hypothetical protein B0J12DRAFT_699855 [Macrophomina phaseolina]